MVGLGSRTLVGRHVQVKDASWWIFALYMMMSGIVLVEMWNIRVGLFVPAV